MVEEPDKLYSVNDRKTIVLAIAVAVTAAVVDGFVRRLMNEWFRFAIILCACICTALILGRILRKKAEKITATEPGPTHPNK
jgi:hypothetical protein